jgi:DNA-binding MarR family transcriptional regulator
MRHPAKAAPPKSGARREHTRPGAAFTALALETFRLNGALLAAGNELCRGTGLTSARWQVLGAIALRERPLTAAQIARAMGQTRQSVQRLVDELESEGTVERLPHPEHRRARLVQLTARGKALYAEMTRRQVPWANRIADGLPLAALETALDTLRALRVRLEADEGSR